MNVYDFDGTIYAGDSSVDFYWYALARKPMILRFFPRQLCGFVLYALKRINKKELKSRFFCFLSGIDGEGMAKDFWEKKKNKIYNWYMNQCREDDIIISASPEFLLQPAAKELGVKRLIASKMDIKTGTFDGENCYGLEKVHRLYATFGTANIDDFYSDSVSDAPMARLAKRAYFVKNGKITRWIQKD